MVFFGGHIVFLFTFFTVNISYIFIFVSYSFFFSFTYRVSGGNYAEHKVILGTHTSDNEPNHLCVAIVRLPTDETLIDARKYDDEKGELGGYGGTSANVEVTIWMNHEGEVNRARYCPQNPFLIGTKTPGGDVLVYDYSKHPTRPASGEKLARPQVRCKGHDDEGYGLAWNPLQAGHLLSGSDDRNVCVWDVNVGGSKTSSSSVPTGNGIGTSAAVTTTSSSSSSSHSAAELQPMYKIANAHSETIEDVAWHCFHKDLFGTVGDDKLLQIWDIREAATTGPRMKNIAHDGDVMSLSFNPFAEYLVLTGGTDKIVKLWDTRSLKSPVHSLVSHEDDVLGVQWSPFNEGLCASSSADRRIMIWDLSKIGQEQNEEDAEDGPPELLVSKNILIISIGTNGSCLYIFLRTMRRAPYFYRSERRLTIDNMIRFFILYSTGPCFSSFYSSFTVDIPLKYRIFHGAKKKIGLSPR